MALDQGIATTSGPSAISQERESPATRSRLDLGNAALQRLAALTSVTATPPREEGRAALARLRQARALRELVDEFVELDAAAALSAHERFEDVGDALGLSRSAAHRQFAHLRARRY
jgi:hypothetical protein